MVHSTVHSGFAAHHGRTLQHWQDLHSPSAAGLGTAQATEQVEHRRQLADLGIAGPEFADWPLVRLTVVLAVAAVGAFHHTEGSRSMGFPGNLQVLVHLGGCSLAEIHLGIVQQQLALCPCPTELELALHCQPGMRPLTLHFKGRPLTL